MKIGELASILGYEPRTLRNWIDRPELKHFFSEGALGKLGAHRILTDSDVLALNTIRYLRVNHSSSWDEIAAHLESGKREQGFPQNAISTDPRTIPLPQAEQAARLLTVTRERDLALEEITRLEEHLAKERADRDTMKEQLLREIGELRQEVGRLQGYIEALKEHPR